MNSHDQQNESVRQELHDLEPTLAAMHDQLTQTEAEITVETTHLQGLAAAVLTRISAADAGNAARATRLSPKLDQDEVSEAHLHTGWNSVDQSKEARVVDLAKVSQGVGGSGLDAVLPQTQSLPVALKPMPVKRLSQRQWWAVAATLIALVAAGLTMFRTDNRLQPSMQPIVSASSDSRPDLPIAPTTLGALEIARSSSGLTSIETAVATKTEITVAKTQVGQIAPEDASASAIGHVRKTSLLTTELSQDSRHVAFVPAEPTLNKNARKSQFVAASVSAVWTDETALLLGSLLNSDSDTDDFNELSITQGLEDEQVLAQAVSSPTLLDSLLDSGDRAIFEWALDADAVASLYGEMLY